MKRATYIYCLTAVCLMSFSGSAEALTVHSCADTLYEFVQTCRDAETKIPASTQRSMYNKVAANCFPSAFQANNGANDTQATSDFSSFSQCSDITENKQKFQFASSIKAKIDINQNTSGNQQCRLATLEPNKQDNMKSLKSFCYASVNNSTVRTQAERVHDITDFYKDFVMQDPDPEKEQFRKDNLSKAKKNCGSTFEYFIDPSSVDSSGTVYLSSNKINILNKYVFGNDSINYYATNSSPQSPSLILIAENDIVLTRKTGDPYHGTAYLMTSGKATISGVTDFTGGINSRELEMTCSTYFGFSISCSSLNTFEVTGSTQLTACEEVELEDDINFSYYRVYLEQLSGCAPTVSLVVQNCTQGGFCEVPTENVSININGKAYTASSANGYRITFDHGDPVTYSVRPSGENTYLFCGTDNTALLSESCSFTTTECVEGATEDLENYVNSMNTSAIYIDTLSSDVKSVDSITLTLKGNTEVTLKDSANNTYTLFSGRDHETSFTEAKVTLPVEYVKTTGSIIPKFKFMTTVDRSTLYPVKSELNVTKVTIVAGKEKTSKDVIVRNFNEGETPDQYLVAIPYAICYDLRTSQATETDRVSTVKYRPVYANAPYYLRGYAVGCPDSGCSGSVTQTSLKNLCSTAAIVKIPKAGNQAKSIVYPTEAAKSLSPQKLSVWSTSLAGNTTSASKTADFTVYSDGSSETEYLNIGYTGNPALTTRVQLTDSGWYSLSAQPAVKHQATSPISTYFYSPVFTVIPQKLALASDRFVINDFYRFRAADGFSYRSSDEGMVSFLKKDAYAYVGTATCPMYYNQKLTISGYLNGYGYQGKLQNNFTNDFFRVPSETELGYSGAVLVIPLAQSATSYVEESSHNPCASTSSSACSGYDDFVAGKGIPFYTTVSVPGVNTETVRRKSASEKFAYYSRLNACLANNDSYTFSEGTDCAETTFTCGSGNDLCVSGNTVTTDNTDITGAKLSTAHQGYASKLRTLSDYTVYLGRIMTDHIVGRGTVESSNTESNTLYSPLFIKAYTDEGWKDVNDSCTVLYTEEEEPYKASLDFRDLKGTITYKLCGKPHNNTAPDCSEKHRTFSSGSLWLQAVKTGTGDAYVSYMLKNTSGGVSESPFFHLEHLYDANTSKGSFKFNTLVGNKRIIERKINTGSR